LLTDPDDGACADSARVSDTVAGILVVNEAFELRAHKPEMKSTMIQFSNTGGPNRLFVVGAQFFF
jgi:hypothetical protein